MNRLKYIIAATQLREKQVANTLKLLDEDATIPFISRYRKEMTGGLDEVEIGTIVKYKTVFEEIEKRKKTILKTIEEQGALTEELKNKIGQARSLTQLEDVYLPYKKKRKTKASVARENGLEPLAKILMRQQDPDIEFTASKFLNDKVKNEAEALRGARDIVAEWINENEEKYLAVIFRNLYSYLKVLFH